MLGYDANRVHDAFSFEPPQNLNEPSEHICHNYEQEQRRKKKAALHKLDNAKFSCFHVRAVVVSGIGFFTVSI